jgi:hypothetical protein
VVSNSPKSMASGANAGPGKSGNETSAGSGQSDNPTQPAITGMSVAGRGLGSLTGGTGGRSDDVQTCVQTAQEAQQVPVDMYIMLDRSASMQEKTGAGPVKWDAVRIALSKFLRDSRSNGLGVGLGFFPLVKPGVPETCTMDMECGMGGPCFNGICKPKMAGSFLLMPCGNDSNCPADMDGCTHDFGQCGDGSICFTFGFGSCGVGFGVGTCQRAQVTGFCGGADSCEATEYAKPAVPIGSLPDNSGPLTDALDAEMTVGRTPTSAALSGALAQAKAYAMAHPTHRVVTVLATDGQPTECDPIEPFPISEIAAKSLGGTPAIPTYVIGVFGPDDMDGRTNLSALASAGGTKSALIVDPTQDVAAQFLDALDKIRMGSIACEYQLPPSPAGSDLDLDRVNVALVESSRSRDFLYVGDAGRCDATPLGWHYDADPSKGKPTKIVACPAACDALKATDNGHVEVRLGCKTMGPD